MRRVSPFLLAFALSCVAHAQTSLDPETVKKMIVFLFLGKTDVGLCAQISKGKPLTPTQVEACVDLDKGGTGFKIIEINAAPDSDLYRGDETKKPTSP